MFLKSLGSLNKPIHPTWLIVLTSIWLATVGNLALWQEFSRLPEMNDLRALWFGTAFVLLIAALVSILLSVLCWRWTLKTVLSIFLIATALGGYFMLTYGVVIDSTMMVNVMQTDLRESRDLGSWKMLLTILLFAIAPMVWLWRKPVKHLSVLRQLGNNILIFVTGLILSFLAVLPIYQDFASTMRNHVQLRFLINPLNSFYALADIGLKPFQNANNSIEAIGLDAKLGKTYTDQPKIPLLILVLGETARSGNFSINGYGRDTTPMLNAIKKNADQSGELTSQTNVWSCGTSTATSLPCMFSHLGKSAFESTETNFENLIDVLDKAGLAVIWLENQSGCKGICDRVYREATSKLNVPEFCNTGECFDEIMLHELDEHLRKVSYSKLSKGAVIVMHQMGSHGPAYYKRSPAAIKKFKPECTNVVLGECKQAEVINAYDNSIVYTDYFLSKVIALLKNKAATLQGGMLYVSDHGESLGEKNIYLHGLPYAIAPDVQKHVPWISWFANDFVARNHLDTDCIESRAATKLSHDNYFHTILGLMDIQTQLYKPELDAYAPCKEK